MPEKTKRLTLLTPVFNEALNIRHLFEEVKRVMDSLSTSISWKYIMVDDGSTDGSWEEIRALRREWPDLIIGLRLSRNFGKEIALTAGLEHMPEKSALLCIDADLQHPPEIIPQFIRQWEEGMSIVVGVRSAATDYSLMKRIGSTLFYKTMSIISDIQIVPHSTDFRLMDVKVVDELRRFTERTRMFRGLSDWLGFERGYVYFEAPSRAEGDTPGYSIRKLFSLAINSMTSFSLLPLRVTGYLGLATSTLSALLMCFILVTDLFTSMVYTPQVYMLTTMVFLIGVVLCALGMIALYIGHIHTEVVGRPLYIMRDSTEEADEE